MNYLVGTHIRTLVIVGTLVLGTAAQGRTDLDNLLFHPVPLAQAVIAPAATLQLEEGTDVATRASPVAPEEAAEVDLAYAARRDAIARYRAAISAALTTDGPYAPSIGEASFSLGNLLAENGEPEEALKAFEHSLQVLRVNHGLYDLQQVPVLRAMIRQHILRQNISSAHDLQEALFNLLSRYHGRATLNQVPALLEWADWNVSMFLLQGGVNPAPITVDSDQLRMRLHDPRLGLAYANYKSVLTILQAEAPVDDPRLVTTERKLAALNFMLNRNVQDVAARLSSYFAPSKDFNSPIQILEQANAAHFLDGSSALRRAIAYSYNAPEPDYDAIAARMMELGDWYLLFDRRSAALDIYEDALKVMESASLSDEAVERIMSPGMPVQTPDADYLMRPANSDVFAGFIDVQFELSKFGMATNPRVIGSSSADKRIEKELLRTIRNCKFRPKFVAGTPVNEEQVQLRYYYRL